VLGGLRSSRGVGVASATVPARPPVGLRIGAALAELAEQHQSAPRSSREFPRVPASSREFPLASPVTAAGGDSRSSAKRSPSAPRRTSERHAAAAAHVERSPATYVEGIGRFWAPASRVTLARREGCAGEASREGIGCVRASAGGGPWAKLREQSFRRHGSMMKGCNSRRPMPRGDGGAHRGCCKEEREDAGQE
jgi:hypothetical protein